MIQDVVWGFSIVLMGPLAALGMTWFFAALVGWTPSCAKQPPSRSGGDQPERLVHSVCA